MKRLLLITTIFALICAVLTPTSLLAAKKKIPKAYKKMQNKEQKMMNKGAFVTIGIAVSDDGRLDMGRTKAQQDAFQKMTQAKKNYVETTVHDFREEIGVGKGNEINDVFRSLTDGVSANLLKGARIVDFQMYQDKNNKKDGTMTYLVLLAITPKQTYQTLMGELEKEKGSENSLYQRYVDSEAQKIHDEKIKKYQEEFGSDK